MIKLIRKLFIKDYDNVLSLKVRSAHGILASVGGIFINLLLFVGKLIIGLISASLSIVSDAINNLSDLLSCFVSLIGFKISSKPADKEHPFGHQRIEYIAGMIVSFVIIAISVLLFYQSIDKLIHPTSDYKISFFVFIVLALSIVFKLLLGLFYRGIGKAIDSVALKANMVDSLMDVLCTSVVFIISIIIYFFPNLYFLDPISSILVSAFILFNGIKMVKETSSPLIGLSPDSDFVKSLVKDIKAHPQVLGIHDLVVHSYGPSKRFVTVHVEIDGYEYIMKSHDIIDNIEEEISTRYGVEITIHMDPLDTKNPLIQEIKESLKLILQSIEPSLTFHDLRIVNGPSHTNIIFDIVKNYKIKLSDTNLIDIISSKMKEVSSSYNCVIKVDQDYVN